MQRSALTALLSALQVPDEAAAAAGDKPAASSFLAVAAAAPADGQRLSWQLLRAIGAGFWLTDAQLVRCGGTLGNCRTAPCMPSRGGPAERCVLQDASLRPDHLSTQQLNV